MHVLFFMHGNIRAGANLVMLRHAVHLAAAHQVSVVFQQDWFDLGLSFVPGHGRLRPLLLRDHLAGTPPVVDVAVTNWWSSAYELPSIPARRYVYYRHGDDRALYATPVFDALIGLIDREGFAWAVVNEHLAAPLRRLGHAPLVLPPGVDVAGFAAARPLLPPRSKALRVMVEGPLAGAFKRVPATIAMLRGVEGIEIVHMAADGSKAEGVEHPMGAVAHGDVAAVYASCDVIVKLSEAPESFGMPVLEQFAAGGTAIVSAYPGHEALVRHGENGFAVELAQPFAAARECLQRLVADPGLLARLRGAGLQTAAAFDWDGLHRRFETFLEASLEGAGAVQPLPIASAYRACLAETIRLWAASVAT